MSATIREVLDGEPNTPTDMDCSEFVLPDEFVDARPAHGQHLCGLGNADKEMSYGTTGLAFDAIRSGLGRRHTTMVISARHRSLPDLDAERAYMIDERRCRRPCSTDGW